jgi:hypothetical protein
MSDQRKYGEEEARQILRLAAHEPGDLQPSVGNDAALSLRELQEIGLQAGIAAESIAEAARLVRLRDRLPLLSTFLARPPELRRVLELPRPVTDQEWDLMVAEFRDAFGSVGDVSTQGGAREWTSGGLRVVLEPTQSGHRLRMSSTNQRLLKLGRIGIVEVVAGLVLLAIIIPDLVASEGLTLLDLIRRTLPHLIVIGSGIGFTVWSRNDLSRWMVERESAMDLVAERVNALIEARSAERR